VIVDGKISTTGTANMDFRSYELNYEVNAVIYDDEITQELEEDFNKDFEKCHLMTLEEYDKTPVTAKLFEAFARVFSSLL
jgi:cardiolipin synthase